MGEFRGFVRGFNWIFGWDFWNVVQRRGVHVNIPEIGSRDGGICFGGILWFYAVLRRECFGRNLDLGFFWFLFEYLRDSLEEGGPLKCVLGEFNCDVRKGGPGNQDKYVKERGFS
jgi:hypothetical protein